MGVPAQLGAKGVEKIWEIKLTDDERTALHKSRGRGEGAGRRPEDLTPRRYSFRNESIS